MSAAEEDCLRLSTESARPADVVEASIHQWSQWFKDAGVMLQHHAGAEFAIPMDRPRIGQVLDNLFVNALWHTPTGGHVELRSSLADGYVVITVTDDGEGIESAALPHVMERFYRADPARTRTDGSGTGVGLAIAIAIAKAIAHAHGGDLIALRRPDAAPLSIFRSLLHQTFTVSEQESMSYRTSCEKSQSPAAKEPL